MRIPSFAKSGPQRLIAVWMVLVFALLSALPLLALGNDAGGDCASACCKRASSRACCKKHGHKKGAGLDVRSECGGQCGTPSASASAVASLIGVSAASAPFHPMVGIPASPRSGSGERISIHDQYQRPPPQYV